MPFLAPPETFLSSGGRNYGSMMDELKVTIPETQIKSEMLVTSPDPLGLQNSQPAFSLETSASGHRRTLTNGRHEGANLPLRGIANRSKLVAPFGQVLCVLPKVFGFSSWNRRSSR